MAEMNATASKRDERAVIKFLTLEECKPSRKIILDQSILYNLKDFDILFSYVQSNSGNLGNDRAKRQPANIGTFRCLCRCPFGSIYLRKELFPP
ncbi:hypothetical protein TNCV_3212761 [Trichonephila clavipes]|nr:hypothetical protein TNCV_3212761 [Trichonephila clavipes]